MKIRLLLTGAGAPGFYGIYTCLKDQFEIYTADADPLASGRFLNLPFKAIPKAKETGFIESVLDLCEEWGIQALLTFVTAELETIAKFKASFASKGIKLFLPNEEQLQISNNKYLLYKSLQNNHIGTPDFVACKDKDSLLKAIDAIKPISGKRVFKPAVSNGSRGLRILHEGPRKANALFEEKPGSPDIHISDFLGLLPEKFPLSIVTEYLPGAEYSVDMICNEGTALLTLPRERLKTRGGVSVQCRADFRKDIIAYCENIVSVLKLHGFIGIQLKLRENGEPVIIEINPRLQGGTSMWSSVGINVPLMGMNLYLYGNAPSFQMHDGLQGSYLNKVFRDI